MNKKIIIYFITAMLILNACFMTLKHENIFGNYYLIAQDSMEDLCLVYKISREDAGEIIIQNTVYAYSITNKHIIIKQHPRKWPNPPNRSKTFYFIVPIYGDNQKYPARGIIGPLSKESFNLKRNELRIVDEINFIEDF